MSSMAWAGAVVLPGPTLGRRYCREERRRLTEQRRFTSIQSLTTSSRPSARGLRSRPALAVSSELQLESATTDITPGNGETPGLAGIQFKPEGYNFWEWSQGGQVHKIHYIAQEEGDKVPILLIHGFGASAYHWRRNIPALSAAGHPVYALCLLGFGWSDKAAVDYTAALWSSQVADFLRTFVKKPAILAGNSLGGYVALSTAVAHPELVAGVSLLNAAGRFDRVVAVEKPPVNPIQSKLVELGQRVLSYLTFLQARRPERIRQVLQLVYRDKRFVDNELVDSIARAAQMPGAGEVYFRVATRVLLQPNALSVPELLDRMEQPLMLLWGDLDPWMTPDKADRILALRPGAARYRLQAGHCPHDEAPELANEALLSWMASL